MPFNMDYYKELYEHSIKSGRETARSKGKAQGNILIADAMLSAMDAFMDPDHFQDQITRVRKHIMEAYNELDKNVQKISYKTRDGTHGYQQARSIHKNELRASATFKSSNADLVFSLLVWFQGGQKWPLFFVYTYASKNISLRYNQQYEDRNKRTQRIIGDSVTQVSEVSKNRR